MLVGILFCIGGAALLIYVIEKLSKDDKNKGNKKDNE